MSNTNSFYVDWENYKDLKEITFNNLDNEDKKHILEVMPGDEKMMGIITWYGKEFVYDPDYDGEFLDLSNLTK